MSAPTRPIAKLLIANRGEIARRVIRTCCELGIATVAVFSEADAEAAFVREADESVALGASAPGASYLRRDAIVAAALLTGADAVHPGYGFLAENSRFASDCVNAGLTFVGPSAEAIRAMASKIEARALMERAGVPVVPGATFGETAGADMTRIARRLGTPLLVKASAGGGGRGIRIVDRPADLPRAIEAARLEAVSAFGDDTVFVE
ncbi:MAG: propionyl-CoA carboxylase alpha chain, partial [Microbacteriaceae bacterium]|nr:propionyl-CoA carboxylase alpha chain [Microbacteriaceae bacterium]